MRILCVDPGQKRIGIAISDPTGSIASPRGVLKHVSKTEDAARILAFAAETGCSLIVVGVAIDEEGGETLSSRRARNLAAAIEEKAGIPVVTWDESGSTDAARNAAVEMDLRRGARRGHLDAAAAAIILQSFLDSRRDKGGLLND